MNKFLYSIILILFLMYASPILGFDKTNNDFVEQYKESIVRTHIENTFANYGGLTDVIIIGIRNDGFILVQKYIEGESIQKSDERYYIYYTKIVYPEKISKVKIK